MTDSKQVCVCFLLSVLGVAALALAGGSMGFGHLAGNKGRPYAARQVTMAQAATTTTTASRMMGLGEVNHRRILGSISLSSLDPNRPACIRSCPAAGGAYTGRGCQKVYQCAG
ncbi:hypothetical protein BS78_06G056100 [Paspalum vaginatum]|nr:hypothetical protein BS78_06G056100 [Paspalum vaginatum]